MTEIPRVRVIGSWRRAFTMVVLLGSTANIAWNVAKVEDENAFAAQRVENTRLLNARAADAATIDRLIYQEPNFHANWNLGHRDGRCLCALDIACGGRNTHLDLLVDEPLRAGAEVLESKEYPLTILPAFGNPSCPPGHLAVGDNGKMRCK